MLFAKVYSKNVNSGKKIICGVNKTSVDGQIRTVGDFCITFDIETKKSNDLFYKDFFIEELPKEEEENHIKYLKSLKLIEDYSLCNSIKRMVNSFYKDDLEEEAREIYDCLYSLIDECLKNRNIKEDFIIKDGSCYELVTCSEDYFCVDNFRITNLPDKLFN